MNFDSSTAFDRRSPDTSDSGGSLRPDLATGVDTTIVVSGERARLARALQVASDAPGLALIVTASLDALSREARSDPSWRSRLLVLPRSLDALEMGRRLNDLAGGIYTIVAIDPDRLWQARFTLELQSRPPSLVVFDAGRVALGGLARHLTTQLSYRRISTLAPQVPTVLLTGVDALVEPPTLAGHLPELEGPLVPTGVSLRVCRLTAEHERLLILRRAIERYGGGLILAPTRGSATRLSTSLARSGADAAAYHLGLLAPERSAVLTAFRTGRLRVLVATAAVLQEEDVPCPPLLALSHPVPSLATLVALAACAEGSSRQVPLILCYRDVDASSLLHSVGSEIPTLAQLRRLYRALRHMAVGETVVIDLDGRSLQASVDDAGSPGAILVMLDLLETAGYLRREEDLPKAAHLTATQTAAGPPDWLSGSVKLRPGVAVPIRPLSLSRALRLQPSHLQRLLLAADRSGSVHYRPIGRDRLYLLSVPPSEAASTLHASLHAAALAASSALTRTAAWLGGHSCREQALAVGLGVPPPSPCGHCDRCRPDDTERQDSDPRLVALAALAGVALDMPRGALYRVVRASLIAGGFADDRREVGAVIDDLLAQGALVVRQGSLGEVYGLSEIGKGILAGRLP